MLKISLTLAGCAALITTAAPAMEPITVTGADSVRVSYADLNLGSSSGLATLEGRVRRAAKKLCVDRRVDDLDREMAGRACVAAALASAKPQIEQAVAHTGETRLASAKGITVTLRR